MYRLLIIGMLWLCCADLWAQRRLVVVSLGTKVPQRDIKVRVDNGPEFMTPWHGWIEVPDSFRRIDFSHPRFQHRYVLANELRGDTIFLIPSLHSIDEVVVYGTDRRKTMMAGIMAPVTPKEVPLPQVVPPGPNVLALLMWTWEHTLGPKVEARMRRKAALKKVRAQEKEYEAKWDALKSGKKE